MIRKQGSDDIGRIMEIWLEGNLSAHDFIDGSYWRENYGFVKTAISSAEVYVYEIDGIIVGFTGITEGYIAGLFVDEKYRSQGIGTMLLDYAKKIYDSLNLGVYSKNERAVRFYLKNGFTVDNVHTDENTSEEEYILVYKK